MDNELACEIAAMPTYVNVDYEGKTIRLKENQISTALCIICYNITSEFVSSIIYNKDQGSDYKVDIP